MAIGALNFCRYAGQQGYRAFSFGSNRFGHGKVLQLPSCLAAYRTGKLRSRKTSPFQYQSNAKQPCCEFCVAYKGERSRFASVKLSDKGLKNSVTRNVAEGA